jgi:hypothetical protein
MADHLSQSNTKSVIEHEARPAAEECIVVSGMCVQRTLSLPHGLIVFQRTGMEDLIWHLEGDLRGGDFIGVIDELDMSHKVRVSRLSPTVNARIYPTNTSGYICHLISLSLPQPHSVQMRTKAMTSMIHPLVSHMALGTKTMMGLRMTVERSNLVVEVVLTEYRCWIELLDLSYST